MNPTQSAPSPSSLASEFCRNAGGELDDALRTIVHCVRQLSDEQLWWRPIEGLNSVANLMLHLGGNVRQWIVSGVGGSADTRRRQTEFAERGPIPRVELLDRLAATVTDAKTVLSQMTERELLALHRIQGFEVTSLQAVLHSVSHFRGHTQEIVHLTRSQLREDYEFALVLTEEQGGTPNA
ncbi:MAG: DUF1572 family protein [Planctomycetota bacterium]|nr:DUF1572 family protein [Planctomycetota bacterium]